MDELTREQLLDEKVAVQKALLYLEGIFGRPVARGDRDLVRPLYDRYRALKRLVIRSGPVSKCHIFLHQFKSFPFVYRCHKDVQC